MITPHLDRSEDKEDARPSSIIDNEGLRNEAWFSTKRSARRLCADPAGPPSSRAEGDDGKNFSHWNTSGKGVYCQALLPLFQTNF